MAGGPHPGSLPGAPCRCARPPMHIFGGSRDGIGDCVKVFVVVKQFNIVVKLCIVGKRTQMLSSLLPQKMCSGGLEELRCHRLPLLFSPPSPPVTFPDIYVYIKTPAIFV